MPVPEVPTNPWPESNYKNFESRRAALITPITGKLPLSELFIVMDEPINSKLFLPRPLEVYTADELKEVNKSFGATILRTLWSRPNLGPKMLSPRSTPSLAFTS